MWEASTAGLVPVSREGFRGRLGEVTDGETREYKGIREALNSPATKERLKVTVGLFAREETEPESSLGLQ